MRYLTRAIITALFLFPLSGFASTTNSPTTSALTFSDNDRAAIESIIKDYLVNKHPEVLKEAYDELQRREQNSADLKSKQALADQKEKIFSDSNTPVGGNPQGDVTVVEFFDFQCGYCKMAEPSIEKLIKDDKGVKFIYKDFPILGTASVTAAEAALASIKQNKYIAFHDALMSRKEHLTEEVIYETAKNVGLNVEKLKKDMSDSAISKQIEKNIQLGSEVGVRGTPLFIIGDKFFPGAMQYDEMNKAVKDARAEEKK